MAPGKIIREKTINNFSLNKPNSLADKLTIKPPHIIDIKNFHTVKTTDKNQVKLFIFTVQSLTQSKGKAARKTGNYDELFGQSLQNHLKKLDDLFIFADEHHLYYGDKFSEAIRELKPKILIGLTGTPHEKTPPQEIIFRYRLGYALHDKLVKTPVLVGRSDSWNNEESKLKDAITLLEKKQKLLDNYTQQQQLTSRKALMLIITKNIEHAGEVQQMLVNDCSFPQEEVLRVDSNSINEAMAQRLQTIDNPDNPIRIIIAAGMLKEGWDVKGVYIIVPLRAFTSEILTEQVIGRGLRLPFGRYTPVNFLNQLEIITHDKFQDLLNNQGALAKNFFGEQAGKNNPSFGDNLPNNGKNNENSPSSGNYSMPDLPISDFQDRERAGEEETKQDSFHNSPKDKNFTISILSQKPKLTNFSLEFILLDKNKQKIFTELGETFSTWEKAQSYLERHEIKSDIDIKQIKINKITEELIKASQSELNPRQTEQLRTELILSIMGDCVTRDNREVKLAEELINDYFLPKSPNWTIIMDCRGIITTQLKRKIQEIAHQYNLRESKDDLIHQIVKFTFGEHSRKEIIASDHQDSSLQKSYQFNKSLYYYDNFDSLLEKGFAILLNDSPGIKWWIRLQKERDFFIYYWNGKKYYPDFLVIENNDYWLIEVKNDNNTEEKVKAKKEVAQKWVNKLNRELIKQKDSAKWHFLYITPKDIKQSHNNWEQLKLLEEKN